MNVLTQQEFSKNKKLLDGYVFWRVEGDMVIVKQVSPDTEVSKYLSTTKEQYPNRCGEGNWPMLPFTV